jgi:hypothetical protein
MSDTEGNDVTVHTMRKKERKPTTDPWLCFLLAAPATPQNRIRQPLDSTKSFSFRFNAFEHGVCGECQEGRTEGKRIGFRKKSDKAKKRHEKNLCEAEILEAARPEL